jgi:hypothetical protein
MKELTLLQPIVQSTGMLVAPRYSCSLCRSVRIEQLSRQRKRAYEEEEEEEGEERRIQGILIVGQITLDRISPSACLLSTAKRLFERISANT